MQILESALAFAITMLVLSLVCSSFVEIIHRVLMMREAGLKYMLGQIFDQVLAKHVQPWVDREGAKLLDQNSTTAAIHKAARRSFVERMAANRAPMGVKPKTTPVSNVASVAILDQQKDSWVYGLLGGRDLTSLTPAQFMERLGSMDVGKELAAAASAAGEGAADAVDSVLTDVAQKFEAFGKEAATYFEGRARLLSVCVAIVLAFAIRVDAIELFNTFLRDPNARNKVIEQAQVVTAQAAQNLQKASNAAPQSQEAKEQAEALLKELQSTVDSTKATVKQYADLGLPIGWHKDNASLNPWAPTCTKDGVMRILADGGSCRSGEKLIAFGWWPWLRLVASLVLGGVLIGLGAPFWYNAVTGLTNIRNIAKDISGVNQRTVESATTSPAAVSGRTPDRLQPVTPVGAFNVSLAAQRPT